MAPRARVGGPLAGPQPWPVTLPLAAAVLGVLCMQALFVVASASPARIVLNEGSSALLGGIDATVQVDYTWGDSLPPTDAHLNYFIGLFSPPVPLPFTGGQSPYMKYPVKPAAGTFQLPVHLVNMRAAHSVALMSMDAMGTYTLIANSNEVGFTNYRNPQHLHLVLQSNDATSMGVQWTALATKHAIVRWGPSPSELVHTVVPTASTFTASQMCGNPGHHKGWRHPAVQFQAVMTGLTPNTKYYYQVGDPTQADGVALSAVISFYSAPVPSAVTETEFFMFGDLGVSGLHGWEFANPSTGASDSNAALQLDVQERIIGGDRSAVVFHIGDIAYAHGYEATWNAFMWQIQNLSQSIPWMTSEGNHERSYPNSGSLFSENTSGGECGVAYNNRFQMPTGSADLDVTWYSVVYGPLTHVVSGSEHAFGKGSAQYAFLERAFAAVDRSVTPWLIFSMHRPFYEILSPKHAAAKLAKVPTPGSVDAMVADLMELLKKYDVDVAFWAHSHSFQRTCYARDWQCIAEGASNTGATVHVLTGAAGADLSDVHSGSSSSETTIGGKFGYSRVFVKDNTMRMQFVDNTPQRNVLDTVTLHSKYPAHAARDSDTDAADASVPTVADPETSQVAGSVSVDVPAPSSPLTHTVVGIVLLAVCCVVGVLLLLVLVYGASSWCGRRTRMAAAGVDKEVPLLPLAATCSDTAAHSSSAPPLHIL